MLRKLGIGALALLGGCAGLLAVAFGLAQTPPAKDLIAGYLAGALGGGADGRRAEVERLEGLLPFDVRLGRLALADAQGVWLEAEDARLRLSPGALLRGEIRLDELGARRVALERLPPAAEEPEPDEPFRLPELPDLPESLPAVVRVDRLHVDRIEVGPAVLGEAAVFALDGRAAVADDRRGADARLTLRRIDEASAALDLTARLDLAGSRLALDVAGEETGGLLAAATRRAEAGTARLSLAGEGPLDDWRGKLLVEGERLARLETAVELAYGRDRRRLGLDGGLTLAPGALPAGLAAVVGERVALAASVGETGPGLLSLDRLAVQAAALRLEGRGAADLNADRIEGRAELRAADLSRLSGLAGLPLDGSAALTLDATGRPAEPALRLGLAGDGVAVGPVMLARLGGSYDVSLIRSPDGAAVGGARVAGAAAVEGLAVEGRPLGERGWAALEVRAEVPPTGEIRVDHLGLATDLGEVAVGGTLDRATLAGRLTMNGAVPDLAAVTAALMPPDAAAGVPPVAGALRLDGEAALGERAERVDLRLALAGEGLSGLPGAAQELVGPTPRLEARTLVEGGGKAVRVESLRLDGAAVALTGDPRLGPAGDLAGRLTLTLPDLSRLERAAGQPTGGRVTAHADLGGTLAAPSVTLDAVGEALRLGAQGADRLTLAGRVAGPADRLAGDVRLAATRGGQALALNGDFAVQERRLRLSRLELKGPGTALAGAAEVDLERLLATGGLKGGVGDLAALSAWHGQDFAGAVDLEVALTAPEGRQDASVKATARGLAGGFGRLERAEVTAGLRDARAAAPAVEAQVRLGGLATPGLELRQATLDARGPLDGLAVNLDAAGTQGAQPLDLRAGAEIAAVGGRRGLLLRTLAGTYAGQPVRLAAPTRLALPEAGGLGLEKLDLRLGPARLAGDLRYGSDQVGGEIRLTGLPLPLLETFGAPPLQGAAEGRLRLSGTPAAPSATLDLDVRDLRPAGADKAVPAASLDMQASADGGALRTRLTLAGLGSSPLALDLSLPARLSLAPAAFAIPPDAALSGRIRGPIDLARVAALAALDRQRVAGVLQSDLRLAGTLARPGLEGRLDLAGGRFDDLTTGASLRGITLAARASGRRLELTELRAADAFGGSATGRGGLTLGEDLRPTFDLALDLAKLRVLGGDYGTAVVSGGARLDGGPEAAAVAGRLTVDQADLRLPEGGSVTVAELDVVTRRRGGSEPAAEPAAGPPPYPFTLDLAVDAPGRLFLRGRGLESEWGGAVAVKGPATSPEVTGELRFRRGFLEFLDRRFAVEEGLVSFDGRRPPIPVVAIRAAATAAEVKAIVRLDGPADDPKVSFSSEPELPQDEILAHALFGRSLAKISPVQGLRLAAAARQLQTGGSGTVGGVLNAVRGATGLDTVDIEGGETTAESKARVGKYLSEGVFLELERGVRPGSGKARVEVELTPNLSVGTAVTEQSQTGVDLEWRYDY